jgi:glycosyltransferase involved in cell wall biosynthesis
VKVLHFLLSRGVGGAETFFVRLGRALHQRGVPQHMVTTPNDARETYLRTHGVPFTVLDYDDRTSKRSAMRTLRDVIRREHPDIIVAWMDRAGRNMPRGAHRTIGRIGGFYELKNYRSCELIVANSPELIEHSRREGRDDAVLITNFVELADHPPVDRSAITRPLLFSAGRLSDQKGYDVLIRALVGLDAHLWIAGRGGGQLENLQALAAELGVADRVEFLGWRPDIPALLAAADIFVMPSRYEGTSNAILEAMAAGNAIITTAGTSVSWFLKDGVNARIVPADDPAALSAAIAELVRDPALAAQLGAAAKETCSSEFGEDAIVASWIEVMEILRQAPPRRPFWRRWFTR